MNICKECAARIIDTVEYDNGFPFHYGDEYGWHEDIEELYLCEKGCETDEPVYVESELGRRFYRRFMCEPKSQSITVKVPK